MGVQELYISKQGLEKLKLELEELKQQRVEVTEKIKDAREFGDLSENAEYQEAKTKQSFIEGRIEEIESTLKMAKVIDARNNASGEVGVDCEGKLIKQRGLFCHSERSEESSPGRPGRFLSATIPACQDGGAKMVPHSQMASQ